MPHLSSAAKSKNKNRENRRSRSRNTTPSSVISAGPVTALPANTPFLELDTSKLLVGSQPQYGEILDRLETKPANLEPKQLEDIIGQLKQLSDAAENRVESCEKAIRLIHDQLKELELESQHKEREQQDQARRAKAKREDSASQKNLKAKKRKDRPSSSEHVEIKREDDGGKPKFNRSVGTPGPVDSPSPSKKIKHSPGTSSLSDPGESPERAADPASHHSPAQSDVSMEEEDNRVIHRPPPVPQHGFFPNPLAPDPIIYHIRDVAPGMSEQEKKEIYSVTSYPTKDLSDQIAGVIPDKDFSNSKPTNQVAANTFLTFAEPYVRLLTEEDMAFLRERGDRTSPFLAIPRGKRTYQEIWAEEDGGMVMDNSVDKLPSNQARGSLETIEDGNLGTDQVSAGPLANRLLSLLRFEHRSPSDNNETNAFANGDDTMDLDGLVNGHDGSEKPLAPATAVADLVGSKSSASQRLDYVQSDERIKSELRYLGLLGQDENPDYDAHHDDDISERLRLLQTELRRVMITNGARKARLLDLAKERLAYQEYITIHEDLDSQVQQAYLKRTRTLGKTKKGGPGGNKPKPGHVATNISAGFGANRARDIGDNARMLMDRRKRWRNCIGPVFKDMKHGVPDKDTTLWEPKIMEQYEKAEVDALEDEVE